MSDERSVTDAFDAPMNLETNLPDEKVADLKQPTQTETTEPEKVEPEQSVKPAEAKAEEANTEPEAEPEAKPEEQSRDPEGRFTKKPKPIASLLEKKHELETALSERDQQIADLNAKIQQLSQQPASPQSDDKIKTLAEKYGLDETLLADIVSTARESVKPELPKEVQQLLVERQAEKEQQAELKAFNARVDSLAKTFTDEQFSDPKVRERLQELAYSTEEAPDGELYYKKELSELYFAYIKPEIEPGKSSAESSQGGTRASEGVTDFEEIASNEAKLDEFARTAPPEQFAKFKAWQREKNGNPPIRRASSV